MLHKRYLVKRGSVFYFRWRVPDSLRPFLGLTEVTRSLHTDTLEGLKQLIQQISVRLQSIQPSVRGFSTKGFGLENPVVPESLKAAKVLDQRHPQAANDPPATSRGNNE